MRAAKYELPAGGSCYGSIPGFEGVWADAASVEECRDELEEVLEEWLLLRLSRQLPVPIADGIDLVVREVVDDQLEHKTFWEGFEEEAKTYLASYPKERAERDRYAGTSSDGL